MLAHASSLIAALAHRSRPYPGSDAPASGWPADAMGTAAPHYWPCDSLNAFLLQMAAQGRCVNASMMLGDRAYAWAQLARARQSGVPELVRLAAQLQAFLDGAEAPCGGHADQA